ncbi:MAG: hypothetical protein ACYCWN_08665 [Ferrimicrobium sp.]
MNKPPLSPSVGHHELNALNLEFANVFVFVGIDLVASPIFVL